MHQSIPRSTNKLITFNGETLCASDWARHIGIQPSTLLARIRAGWSVEEIIGTATRQRTWTPSGGWTQKTCVVCSTDFSAARGNQQYCSRTCRRSVQRQPGGSESVEAQYKAISGNWARYFSRLLARDFRRDGLTTDILIRLLEKQQGRCALSGVELTCQLERGVRIQTNASIDRRIAGGPYTEDNIQLVCAVINKFRIDTPVDEFVWWCAKVANHALQKPEGPSV